MIYSIAHVNLARTLRGGERQTILLIKFLKLLHPDLQQYLICRKNSEIVKFTTDIKDLTVIEISSRLQGHLKLANKAQIISAHEAKAVHWASIHHLLYRTPFTITRRVPQQIKNTYFNALNYENAARVIAISDRIKDEILQSFNGKLHLHDKTTLIYSALSHISANNDTVKALREHYQGLTVFGHIGAYVDKHKGQKVLIEAGIKFLAKYPNTRFILLGKGKDEEELKELTRNYPQFEWLGFKNNVIDYIEAMDIFLFPSRNEGLGSTLLDVMDHNVPIIASNVDGIPEIIHHEKTGLLHENGNSEDLYDNMCRLCNDNALKETLITNAKNSLSTFTPEYMAKCYSRMYEDILSSK